MPSILEVIESLDKLKKLHASKNEDYASDTNPFMNFEITAQILSYFDNDMDRVFVWPIANKIGRIANLLSRAKIADSLSRTTKIPNHESVLDSLDDIAVYTLLWKAHIMRREKVYTTNRRAKC